MRRFFLLAGWLALSGCATTGGGPAPQRAVLDRFAVEARFALRVERPMEATQSASGRLSWEHDDKGDHLLVADPFGRGVAEMTLRPGQATLRTGEGKVRESADGAALLQEATGYTLPLARLPDWLRGRVPGVAAEMDAQGRPLRLRDNGWLVEYAYGDDTPDGAPVRLIIRREAELELRLGIEEWRVLP